jgi:beta-lactamase class D
MRNILILFLPIIIVFAACSPNNVTVDNSLKKYFDAQNVTGCFGLFDNGQGHFTIYNLSRFRDSAYKPDSTFNIIRNLIGIQTGRLKDEKDTLRSPIGQDTLKRWLDTLGYNPTKITADEQLGLLKKLYFEQLPFFARTQQLVVKTMLREDNSNYKLSYITSEGQTEKGHDLHWVGGWIEENKHPYFFVLQLEDIGMGQRPAPADTRRDLSASRISLLKEILKQYEFMKGKK